ncbi:hypothetical protein ACFL6I_07510 [candidate division KSB1 bacterium]
MFIKKDHTLSHLHTGLSSLLFLSGMSLLLGLIGFFVELYFGVYFMTEYIEQADRFFYAMMQGGIFLILISTIAAVSGAVLWFILTIKILKIELHEKQQLLEITN